MALLAGLALSAASCKKDSNYSELPTLSGYLDFSLQEYASPGTVLTLKSSGASHPEGGDYGIYWSATKTTEKSDTTKHIGVPVSEEDGSFSFTVPDSLYTITVNCTMYATGYQSMSNSHTVTVVKSESLSNLPKVEGEKSYADSRDETEYGYVNASGLDWMNRNLAYAPTGTPYSGCEPMTELFGNLYTWEEASVSCPEGWRLPTLEEWKSLCGGSFDGASGKLMADAYFNGEKMWEYWPAVNIRNSTGMNFIPAGYGEFSGEKWKYRGKNEYAFVWTGDSSDGQAAYIGIYVDQPDVMVGRTSTEYFGASVRCVRETE